MIMRLRRMICMIPALMMVSCTPAEITDDDQSYLYPPDLAQVIDADTLKFGDNKFRMFGYDSPEKNSMCGVDNVFEASKLFMREAIANKQLSCVANETDRYGRGVGRCEVDGQDLGEMIVSAGWGRDWPKYSNGRYADFEKQAREQKRGLWGLNCSEEIWGDRDYSN